MLPHHLRVSLHIVAFMTCALMPNTSFPSPVCAPLRFTMQVNGAAVSFDVAELRKNRPELYEILRNDEIQGLYSPADRGVLRETVVKAFDSPPARNRWTKDQQQKIIRFFTFDALKSLDDMTFACGSFIDGIAAELSLTFTQEESIKLAKIISDPLHDRFLRAMRIKKSQSKVPREIQENINKNVLPAFKADFIARCEKNGLTEDICNQFQIGPIPFN